MSPSDGFPTVAVVLFLCFYFLVFVLSAVGNSFVLYVCYKTVKGQGSSNPLKRFIANLAIADLTFTVLSLLNFIKFKWTWIGGQVTCKLQGFLIEACYTASITTLVLISFERLKAVVNPFSARSTSPEGTLRKLLGSWLLSLLAASPLLYAYEAQMNDKGTVFCTNITFGDLARQIYYSIHALCFFLVPLIYIIYVQINIFLTLRSSVLPIHDSFTTACSKRHLKVAKPLVALTIAFATCWSPFILVRALIYFHLTDGGYIWRATQLLIFLNSALDPILYGIYGENLKPFLKRCVQCRNYQTFAQVESSTAVRTREQFRTYGFGISRAKTISNLHVSYVQSEKGRYPGAID